MTRKLIAFALAATLGAGAASAQTVDARHYDQEQRIHQGVRNGAVTPGEAYRLQRQQHSIDRQQDRMRWRNGGRLTSYDRSVLQHRENRASRHIYDAKHNWRRD